MIKTCILPNVGILAIVVGASTVLSTTVEVKMMMLMVMMMMMVMTTTTIAIANLLLPDVLACALTPLLHPLPDVVICLSVAYLDHYHYRRCHPDDDDNDDDDDNNNNYCSSCCCYYQYYC